MPVNPTEEEQRARRAASTRLDLSTRWAIGISAVSLVVSVIALTILMAFR